MYITYCTGAHFADIHNILNAIFFADITDFAVVRWYKRGRPLARADGDHPRL